MAAEEVPGFNIEDMQEVGKSCGVILTVRSQLPTGLTYALGFYLTPAQVPAVNSALLKFNMCLDNVVSDFYGFKKLA